MAEEKFASLSSGLLARKGAAKPAMRRQGFNPNGSFHEDLGWNDMGFEAPRPIHEADELEAPVPPIRQQLDQLAEDFEGQSEASEAPEGFDAGNGGLDQVSHDDQANDDQANDYHCGLSPIDTPAARKPADVGDIEDVGDSDDVGDLSEAISAETVFEPAPIEAQVTAPVIVPEPEREPVIEAAPTPIPERVIEEVAAKTPARAKAAFTLRLDKERHLKLRLASAMHNRSAQALVTEALDRFLADMPELDALAKRASNDTIN